MARVALLYLTCSYSFSPSAARLAACSRCSSWPISASVCFSCSTPVGNQTRQHSWRVFEREGAGHDAGCFPCFGQAISCRVPQGAICVPASADFCAAREFTALEGRKTISSHPCVARK